MHEGGGSVATEKDRKKQQNGARVYKVYKALAASRPAQAAAATERASSIVGVSDGDVTVSVVQTWMTVVCWTWTLELHQSRRCSRPFAARCP